MIGARLGQSFACVLILALPAGGDTTGSAVATVVVSVEPSVAVAVSAASVQAVSVRTNEFAATVRFHVDANTPLVQLFVEATALHKTSEPPASIDLDLTTPVSFAFGDALPAASDVVYFRQRSTVDGLDAMRTPAILLRQARNEALNTEVFVILAWKQGGPVKPAGLYVGKVKLTALQIP